MINSVLLVALAATAPISISEPETPPTPPTADVTVAGAKVAAFKQEIPGAAFSIEMVPIPGSADGKIKPFFITRTEVTWDAYDAFLFNKDDESGLKPLGADVLSRPSRPYIPPDSGFGHAGYATICVSFRNVTEYCKWLTARSGLKYRLATEEEWEHAAAAGTTTKWSFGDDPAKLGDYAWFTENSDESTHKVATKKPNPWGLYDIHGNVAEWVTGKDAKNLGGVVKGGSWDSKPEDATVKARLEYNIRWQKTDPQVPKSKWWMSDGQHVGFRVVCEIDDKTGKPAAAGNAPAPATPEPAAKPAGTAVPAPATPTAPATPAAPK